MEASDTPKNNLGTGDRSNKEAPDEKQHITLLNDIVSFNKAAPTYNKRLYALKPEENALFNHWNTLLSDSVVLNEQHKHLKKKKLSTTNSSADDANLSDVKSTYNRIGKLADHTVDVYRDNLNTVKEFADRIKKQSEKYSEYLEQMELTKMDKQIQSIEDQKTPLVKYLKKFKNFEETLKALRVSYTKYSEKELGEEAKKFGSWAMDNVNGYKNSQDFQDLKRKLISDQIDAYLKIPEDKRVNVAKHKMSQCLDEKINEKIKSELHLQKKACWSGFLEAATIQDRLTKVNWSQSLKRYQDTCKDYNKTRDDLEKLNQTSENLSSTRKTKHRDAKFHLGCAHDNQYAKYAGM